MSIRLVNDNNPKKTLSISNDAWYRILELAEDYGWNPMGTVLPAWWPGLDYYEKDHGNGPYTGSEDRLVLLEDALNLADALERAFLEYEPEVVYEELEAVLQSSLLQLLKEPQPSIGAVSAVMDFCQEGAFWIERY